MYSTLQDDLNILREILEEHGDTDECTTEELVDLYLLLSDVSNTADDIRKTIGDELDAELDAGDRLHGNIGYVRSVERTQESLRDEDIVYDRFDEAGIAPEVISAPDQSKVDDALEMADVDREDVYEERSYTYVQKDHVDDHEKRRLYGDDQPW